MESTDIDDRVRATNQLQRERNFSNSILQTANTLIICLDSQARITVFNAECEKVTGYKFDEVVGKSWPEVFLPEEFRHAGLMEFGDWVRKHPHDRYEGPIITKSGETRIIHWSNSSFVFEDTGELMAIAMGTDITELKRTEERLRESEMRMSLALKGTGAGLWDWDMINDRVYYAPEWKSMLGYAEDEVENTFMAWKRLWHPDDVDKIEKAMAEHLAGKTEQYSIEHRLRHKDGSWRRIMTRGGIFKDATGKSCRWVGCNVDITQLRQIEESLARKNEELDRYFASSMDLLCIATTQGEFVRLNPEWERVLGYSITDLEGKSFLDLIHPDDLERTLEVMSRLAAQQEVLSFENRYRCKDGSYRWVEWRSKPEGKRIYAVARDITERNRMRDSLAESQARNAAILKGMPDLIFVIGRDGYYREFTGGYADELLVPPDRVVGSHLRDAIPEQLATTLMAMLQRVVDSGKSERVEYTLDLQGVLTDFEARYVRCGDDECLVIVRNVTERKKLEKEIQEANERLRLEHLELKDKNIALKVILSQIQQEANEVKSHVNSNVEKLIIPVIERFRRGASEKDRVYANQLESLVLELTSSFASNLHQKSASLTPREIEICNMIKGGLQSKEIADELGVSLRTVEKFRQRIRTKLGIANQDINLATFLKAL
ncbi:MAG: PAS domain S-box protein [bacterium]|nr:PAS domain S-box protein [bacterium]